MSENATFKFLCPSCKEKIEAEIKHQGRKLYCPECSIKFIIPQALLSQEGLPSLSSTANLPLGNINALDAGGTLYLPAPDLSALLSESAGQAAISEDDYLISNLMQNEPSKDVSQQSPVQKTASKGLVITAGVLIFLIFGGLITLGVLWNNLPAEDLAEQRELSIAELKQNGWAQKKQWQELAKELQITRISEREQTALTRLVVADSQMESNAMDSARQSYMEAARFYQQSLGELKICQQQLLPQIDYLQEQFKLLQQQELLPRGREFSSEEFLQLSIEQVGFALKDLRIEDCRQQIQQVQQNIAWQQQWLALDYHLFTLEWKHCQKADDPQLMEQVLKSYPATLAALEIEGLLSQGALQDIVLSEQVLSELAQIHQQNNLQRQRDKITHEKQLALAALAKVHELKLEDGSRYEGQLKNGLYHGHGQFVYANGNQYNGQWLAGKRHGNGSFTFSNGDVFSGEWRNDQRQGQGRYSWPNANALKGAWLNDQRHGAMELTLPRGKTKTLLFHQDVDITSSRSYESYLAKMQSLKDKKMTSSDKRRWGFTLRLQNALGKIKQLQPNLILPYMQLGDPLTKDGRAALKEAYFSIKRYAVMAKKKVDFLGTQTKEEQSANEIYGVTISSSHLGVILDASGSMTSYLEKLKMNINDNFYQAAYREVIGCDLSAGSTLMSSDTMGSVMQLIDEEGVDTIYWFSDLNDMQDKQALLELTKLLQDSFVKLYVTSVGYKPTRELKKVISDSGGKILRYKK